MQGLPCNTDTHTWDSYGTTKQMFVPATGPLDSSNMFCSYMSMEGAWNKNAFNCNFYFAFKDIQCHVLKLLIIVCCFCCKKQKSVLLQSFIVSGHVHRNNNTNGDSQKKAHQTAVFVLSFLFEQLIKAAKSLPKNDISISGWSSSDCYNKSNKFPNRPQGIDHLGLGWMKGHFNAILHNYVISSTNKRSESASSNKTWRTS